MRTVITWSSICGLILIAVSLGTQGVQPIGSERGETLDAAYTEMVGN